MVPIQIGQKSDHGFDQPLGLLSDCHRRIERFLNALIVVSREEKGAALSEAGRNALEKASTYFRTAAPIHTADEEESLFPLLRSRATDGPTGIAATLDFLESEHHDNEEAHARVDTLVDRWLKLEHGGLEEADATELLSILESLEPIYAKHIQMEDGEIYPAARRMLADHELENIGREMAERRGLVFRGPLARYFGADHDRLHDWLGASLTGEGEVRPEPFAQFRAGILRHISMEEKFLIPQAQAANDGQRPAIAGLLKIDHSAIAALLVPPPTPEIVQELRSILDRHDPCEEEPGGLYDLCDLAIGPEAALRLVAEMQAHPEVAVKAYNPGPRVERHLRASVERSWAAWEDWQKGR